MNPEILKKTIELLKSGQIEAAKATFGAPASATSGIQAYNLDPALKNLVPQHTPLWNTIPRVGGQFATQANWRAVTAIDSAGTPIGVPEGTRNAAIAVTTTAYSAVFKTFSVEASASLQASLSGDTFENVQGRARKSGAQAFVTSMELVILGGNASSTGIALGTPATPSGAKASSGGSISEAAQYCYVVALTVDGKRASSVTGGVATTSTVSPADGSNSYSVNRGSSQKSAEGSATSMTGSTNLVTWTTTAIRGAVAYAWYIGASTGAANCKLAAITTTNKYISSTNAPTTTQAATAITADSSQNEYDFDGVITQVSKSGSNGYWISQDGATLTADTKGGITEFNTLLLDRFQNYKVYDYAIYASPTQVNKISDLIRTGSTSTPFSIQVKDGNAGIVGGGRVVGYIHPITGNELPIVAHPDIPDGTILFRLLSAGSFYNEDRIPNVWQLASRLEPTSVEWPPRNFNYEIAVVYDGVLQGYFPAGNGVIANVGTGVTNS